VFSPFIITNGELRTLYILSHAFIQLFEPHNLPRQGTLHGLTLCNAIDSVVLCCTVVVVVDYISVAIAITV
jgi:hypothetical protein